ncbi:MAG: endo-1,4-beta-xylanase [Gemmatimonadaceae bacterium]|nr:endo-1,4-beta-xylanase [Gemmatimonadaceae bacterium]
MLVCGASGCRAKSSGGEATASSVPAASTTQPALKTAFREDFLIGGALNPEQFNGRDTKGGEVITQHFNTITPENVLKWEHVHPERGRYDFVPADAYVAYGERHKMFIVGHTLVWHSQTPRWVFQDAAGAPVSRDTLLARMRDHIHTVAGRYKGRIHGWDVVNEALNEDGTLRQSPWLTIIGPDYIAKAFEYAREADPNAQLYYNDYSLENPAKRAGAIRIIRELQARRIPIQGVGMQGHLKMDWPSVALEDSTITEFAATGVKVHITELDIDVLPQPTRNRGADVSMRAQAAAGLDPYKAALPDSMQQALAARYAAIFAVYLRHRDVIDRVTFWGVADGDSWLNGWPIPGRTSYPLLFDRAHQGKPALDSVLAKARGPRETTPSRPRGEQ